VVLLFGADGAIASFFEEGVGVVVAGVVVAEVVVPVPLFDAVVHVDFAEDGDLVAGLLEEVGEERDVGRERLAEVLVGERSGGARIHAGERGGAGGSAECIGAEGVVEAHAFGADAVVIGGFEERVAGERQGVGALAFAEEVDNVRPFRLCLRGCGSGRNAAGGEGSGGERSVEEVAACGLGSLRDGAVLVRHKTPFEVEGIRVGEFCVEKKMQRWNGPGSLDPSPFHCAHKSEA
jgi:hypothetical protein